jgi:hypothetical protein
MPNTLGHFGVQGVATRLVFRNADPKWIFVGSILPDVPWILRRGVIEAFPSGDPYQIRLYAIVQSSLAGSLLLASGLAFFSKRPRLTFLVLAWNCLLHLLLDAVQIKWGSGYHLGAPFTWKSLDYGLFWPESVPTYLLTAFGALYFAYAWWRRPGLPVGLQWPRARPLALAVLLLAGYFALPLAVLPDAEHQDLHFTRTLRHPRAGAPIELDRNTFRTDERGDFIVTWARTEFAATGARLPHTAQASMRGVFRDRRTIEVREIHDHGAFHRDLMSYVGLGLLALLWFQALWKLRRRNAGDAFG